MRTCPLSLLVLTWLASGCLTPGEPPAIRYYTANPAVVGASPVEEPSLEARDANAPVAGPERDLWLRRVSGPEHLKQRFVWSRGVEYGFRELERWTEEPVEYLRSALEDQLFPSLFRRSDVVGAQGLEVELKAFEEVLGASPRARVALRVHLRTADGETLLDERFGAETPVDGDEPADTARAMARSLADATAQAVARIDEAANRH